MVTTKSMYLIKTAEVIDKLIAEGRKYFRYGPGYGVIRQTVRIEDRNKVLIEVEPYDEYGRIRMMGCGIICKKAFWISWFEFEYDILGCRDNSASDHLFTYEEMKNEIQRRYNESMKALNILG